MGFYDRLEEISDWIDWEIDELYYYLRHDHWFIKSFRKKKLNNALDEYSHYNGWDGFSAEEEACLRAAEAKAIELINQNKFWWMKEFKVKEKP